MAEIIRGKTNQKGCHVCGRPIKKIGENALVLKDSDGNIAFCSTECADKFDPKMDLGAKKKESKKKKIDDLLMVSAKPAEKKVEPKTPAKKVSKPKTAGTKKPATKKTSTAKSKAVSKKEAKPKKK